MKITIEGATEAFAEKLVALAAKIGAELEITTVDTNWSVDRAERYLRSLTADARTFAARVVEGAGQPGFIDADTLREAFPRGLRGPSNALGRAVDRGAREGWWPEGMSAPVSVVYDPERPGWKRAIAYSMTFENVPHFQEALRRVSGTSTSPQPRDERRAELNWEAEDAPAALTTPPTGWGADDDVPRALDPDANSGR
ncbi:hypothetical protein ACFVVP_26110 [Streptomyces sp. NPDC058128]|uniref:hypothetical protein n=1 Tax=Streptomyces sp. NPDC058128 TaxID=3346352 RepID=UPI0036F13847